LLSEGQIFDNTYRLVRLIGEGGMGAVYEATHARLAGRYAIKVLLQRFSADSDALIRFEREARITSFLQHPNVVQVIDHNTTADGTEYLVMEYLVGESLAKRLARTGPLPLDIVVGIIEQIAAGLAAAHAHGIVHRDLKPENVFLVPVEGRETVSVKILDFGISRIKDTRWGAQAPDAGLCGTPQYMAPEQIDGRVAEAVAATDQFALAVIAHEMLTGRNPFEGVTVAAIFARVLRHNPAPTGIGGDVDLVVHRGLAKSSHRRFPSVTNFSDALRDAASGRLRESQRLATIAYAAGQVANFESRRSRRRHWGLSLFAVVVATVSMSFVLSGTTNRHPSPGRAQAVEPPLRLAEDAEAPDPMAAGMFARATALATALPTTPAPLAAEAPVLPSPLPSPSPSPSRVTRDTRPVQIQPAFLSPSSRPRPIIAPPITTDDNKDDTMPLDDGQGHAR
jgi:eukaryotic-like serine/threonine-protein kinase